MRRLNVWMAAAAMLTLAALAGCGSDLFGLSLPDSAHATGGNGNTQNENDPGTVNGLLTDEEAAAVSRNLDLIEQFSDSFGALPAAGLPALPGAPAEPPVADPDCPSLTVDPGRITLDFGTNGCSPTPDWYVTYSGTILFEMDVAGTELLLEFDQFGTTPDGEDTVTVTGTAHLVANENDDALTLDAVLDLLFDVDGGTLAVAGVVSLSTDLNTGESMITTADVTITDETGVTTTLEASQIHFDSSGAPYAGTVTLQLGAGGPHLVSVAITFTEDTPIDGSVLVSVNGSSPVSILLDELGR
ncbi:MAG: hypothetical protein JXB13_12490 [Phycisphaerae bacterium]|nr:hypothetical protein [Phycisphaerae bacterium]